MKRVQITLSDETHKELRVACLQAGITLKKCLCRLVHEFLECGFANQYVGEDPGFTIGENAGAANLEGVDPETFQGGKYKDFVHRAGVEKDGTPYTESFVPPNFEGKITGLNTEAPEAEGVYEKVGEHEIVPVDEEKVTFENGGDVKPIDGPITEVEKESFVPPEFEWVYVKDGYDFQVPASELKELLKDLVITKADVKGKVVDGVLKTIEELEKKDEDKTV